MLFEFAQSFAIGGLLFLCAVGLGKIIELSRHVDQLQQEVFRLRISAASRISDAHRRYQWEVEHDHVQ